jgi:hypothetical protein
MTDDELGRWFAANRELLETAYLAGEQPWQQSGFGLHSERTYEDWEALRRPVADCFTRSGTLLDIGCANGYLIECAVRWAAERGIAIIPYGLDLSDRLIDLACARLPQFAGHLFAGNAWEWAPPRAFDYVRTELVYVPDHLQRAHVERLLARYLAGRRRLLVAEYRPRGEMQPSLPVDRSLSEMGFTVESVRHGFLMGEERTRIAVLRKP